MKKLSPAQAKAVEYLKEHGELVNYRPFWSAEGVERNPISDHHPELVPVWHVDRKTLLVLERLGIVEFTEYDERGIQTRVRLKSES
ncbi:MAG: hypothetical protein WCF45_10535 [Photobacterium halotolerans]